MATYLVHLLDGRTHKVNAETIGYNLDSSMFEGLSDSGVVFMAPRDQVRSVELADSEVTVNVCLTEDRVRALLDEWLIEQRQWSRSGIRM
jgi:hypothetical protein